MQAIQLNDRMRINAYASRGIGVTPNPPQVGAPTAITLYLTNPESRPVTITRIETMIAQFGMGLTWEKLPVVGPFELPADSDYIEEVRLEWTPQKGGHRCVRATIYTEPLSQPLHIGCNLHVIEAEAEHSMWQVPFRLGNPEAERAPVALAVGGQHPDALMARLIVGQRMVHPGEQIWLNPGEEVDAQLLLRARTPEAIESIHTIEAFINGRFIDGIQVELHRPAFVARQFMSSAERVSEPERIVMGDAAMLVH